MRPKLYLKLFACIIVISSISVIVQSCRKDDTSIRSQNSELENQKLALKNELLKTGSTVTIPVNEKIHAFYADSLGLEVSPERRKKPSSIFFGGDNSIISACDFSNSPTAVLNYYSVTSDCANGIKISWNYTISTNNNIVAVNAAHPTNKTLGKYYLYQGATLVYSDLAVPVASITDVGVDGSNPGYELFSVTFTTGWISNSYYAATYSTKLGGTLVTNCTDVEAFPIALQSYSATAYQFPNTNPCVRIDPYHVNNVTNPFRVWGEDPLGTCSGIGYVYPDLQEINFSLDGGSWIGGAVSSTLLTYSMSPSPWTPYPNFGAGTSHLGYVDPHGLMVLQYNAPSGVHGVHSLRVRQRNIKYNGTASSYGGTFPNPNPGTNCCAGAWGDITAYSITFP